MSLAAMKLDDHDTGPRTAGDGQMHDGPLKCVLLDDSRFDRRHLRSIAANSRYDIEFVETSTIAETRAVLRKRLADFAVFDNLLPDGSGIEFAKQLSGDAKMNGIPVIMTTGASSEEVAIKALRVGAADYLTKEDLSVEAFDQAVENALKRGQARNADNSAMISNLQAENAALRRIALRNMRLLKSQVMPLLSFAWRMLKGKQLEDAEKPTIAKGLEKATRTVTGLIDDTVITSATHKLNDAPEPVELNAMVKEIVQDDAGEISTSRAHIKVGNLPVLSANRAQMAMLFEELLVSSVRCTRFGQVPEIEIGSGTDPDGNPIIWMTEKGLQLSARKQMLSANAMELGADPSPTPRDPHSWSLCQRLVEKNGGAFRIAENNTVGSKVMMRFPKTSLQAVEDQHPITA